VWKFGEKPTLVEHFDGGGAMSGWVDAVEAMCKDGECGEFVSQGGAVCQDVNAVGESADDESTGSGVGKVTDEGVGEFLSVGSSGACADDADDMFAGVEIDCALAVKEDGGVATFAEACGVVGIGEEIDADVIFLYELQFLFSPPERIRLQDGVGDGGADAVDLCEGTGILAEDKFGIAVKKVQQTPSKDVSDAIDHGESDAVKILMLFHIIGGCYVFS
jgi:hypothetical protein